MTFSEICNIMAKNRRGINFIGKGGKFSKPVHPIMNTQHGITVRFEYADPFFNGWPATATMKDFSWSSVIPAMASAERDMFKTDAIQVKSITETKQCPMMVYDRRNNTLTAYFTSNADLANKLLHYTVLSDDTLFMDGFKCIDDLEEAYMAKIVTHKTTLNTGRMRRYTRNEGETRGSFLRRISFDIDVLGYDHIFTEVVYGKDGKPSLFFWVCKSAVAPATNPIPYTIPEGYIDTDVATARQAEVTQLMLSSKLLGTEISEKVLDFLYKAATTALKDGRIGEVSDGYHTFNELYHHRALLFATICNMLPAKAWKSKHHDDPEFPMYDGMFICGINTPKGQATYHYDIDPYWDMFNVPELPTAPKFDGHTPDEAVTRIFEMADPMDVKSHVPMCIIQYRNMFTKDCDKFLIDGWNQHAEEYDLHTKFYVDGCDMLTDNNTFTVAFRFPGATRGHVVIDRDTGRVSAVQFYDTAYEKTGIACYTSDINSLILRWEGGLMPGLAECCRHRVFGWTVDSDDGSRA